MRAGRWRLAHLPLLERGSGNPKEDTVAGKILCDRMTRAGQNDTGEIRFGNEQPNHDTAFTAYWYEFFSPDESAKER